MNTLRLAWRGLLRNRRRSLVTLLAIALGFAAITLFAGYTKNVYEGLAQQAIHAGLLGHLTLNKRGMTREGKLDPGRYLFNAAEIARIKSLLDDEPHIELIAPRLTLSGLASNSRVSTIFIAEGIAPQAMRTLQKGNIIKRLDPENPQTVLFSVGLAELLGLRAGDTAQVLTGTVGGQANAADVTLGGTFDTGNAGNNDKFVYMPLAFAQSLYDTEGGADRLTLLLDDDAQTDPVRMHLTQRLNEAGLDLEIHTWRELSDFYNQVHDMFDMIFAFIFSIVLTVVLMSVTNSMGMTVIERTREIGALRAIGLRRKSVLKLFALESLLLTLLGCASGLALTLAVRYGVNAADIAYTPPNSSSPVPLLVSVDATRTAFTFALMVIVGTLAACLPALRAAKRPIIDALGHV